MTPVLFLYVYFYDYYYSRSRRCCCCCYFYYYYCYNDGGIRTFSLPGVGPAEHLKSVHVPVIHHSPGVGQNLMDHVAVGGLVFPIDYPVSLVMNRVVNVPAALR